MEQPTVAKMCIALSLLRLWYYASEEDDFIVGEDAKLSLEAESKNKDLESISPEYYCHCIQ